MTNYVSNLKVGKKIGSGFFGEVCSATDDVHGGVAVKIIRQQPKELDSVWCARKANLLAEGHFLSQAKHANVVQIHHALESETSDAVLLVMEYCSGGCLQEEFEDGPLSLKSVRNVATDVCLGLEALHARNMLHRDIKPGNLLRDSTGRTKLSDFGLVTDDLILGYGSQAGYSDHIAYEVWQGVGTSVRSDVMGAGNDNLPLAPWKNLVLK